MPSGAARLGQGRSEGDSRSLPGKPPSGKTADRVPANATRPSVTSELRLKNSIFQLQNWIFQLRNRNLDARHQTFQLQFGNQDPQRGNFQLRHRVSDPEDSIVQLESRIAHIRPPAEGVAGHAPPCSPPRATSSDGPRGRGPSGASVER